LGSRNVCYEFHRFVPPGTHTGYFYCLLYLSFAQTNDNV
jgi:hypothetical protein